MNRFSILTNMLFCALLFSVLGCSSESKMLKVSPAKLDFGDVNLGDTIDIEVTLKNKYGKDVTIMNMDIIGSIDYIISSGGTVPFHLIKNDEHKLTITFAPSITGQITAMLIITHDASTRTKDVDIKGVGVPVARIELSDTAFDFGSKIINRTHTHDLDIENIGTADLNISNLSFVGASSTLYSISAGGSTPINITPGSIITITIAFDPVVIGNYIADLEIYHNAVNENSPIIYPVSGDGIDVDPQITLSQSSPWDFGSVATTMPSTQICEIENTGIDPLTVTSATLATGTAFTVDSLKDSNGNVINFPQTIAVTAKIMLSVKFSPTLKTMFNDTLSIEHDGTNEATPLNISLAGEGRDEISKTFTYTGAAEQWTIPAGVTSIVVECFGAQGGEAQGGTGLFGKGGMAKATVPVTPADTVSVYVGGAGITIQNSPTGGWNGGGGTECSYPSIFPGTGGGGSDIRIGGTALTDRKVVGAGGGGGGYTSYNAKGGDGGGLVGQSGSGGSHYNDATGGTQTAGGAAGNYSGSTFASPGTLGIGGRGKGNSAGGGGGGGGYYGGGGGLLNSGAGGSSFYDAAGNTDKSTQSGIRSGNGEVTFKY